MHQIVLEGKILSTRSIKSIQFLDLDPAIAIDHVIVTDVQDRATDDRQTEGSVITHLTRKLLPLTVL